MALEANDGGRLTAHEFVRETLRKAILRGDLPGGSRLIQADLAAQLKVSTTPVREALRDLATEGMITLDRHRGGVVRELNWDDMQEIVAIRQALEPLIIRLAMERITDEELRTAEALHQAMSKEPDVGTWAELNQKFHAVFHEAAGSRRLLAIAAGLQEAAATYVTRAQQERPQVRKRSNAEHRGLLKAMRDRDVDAAIAVQMHHIVAPLEENEIAPARTRSAVRA
jgi:DNA-binding GntR family transcriptional regulator